MNTIFFPFFSILIQKIDDLNYFWKIYSTQNIRLRQVHEEQTSAVWISYLLFTNQTTDANIHTTRKRMPEQTIAKLLLTWIKDRMELHPIHTEHRLDFGSDLTSRIVIQEIAWSVFVHRNTKQVGQDRKKGSWVSLMAVYHLWGVRRLLCCPGCPSCVSWADCRQLWRIQNC